MPRIDEMWAWVAEDQGPDDEGIVAFQMGHTMVPLVGADKKRMESLRGVAQQIANDSKKEIKLLRFTERTDMGGVNVTE